MKLIATTKKLQTLTSDCAVVPLFQGSKPASYRELNALTKNLLERVIKQTQFTAKYKETLVIHTPDQQHTNVILVGCGTRSELNTTKFIQLAEVCGKEIIKLNPRRVLYCFADIKIKETQFPWILRILAANTLHALYRYTATFKKQPKKSKLNQIYLHCLTKNKAIDAALAQATALNQGMLVARDLGNLPGNICTPTYIAKEARKLAKLSNKVNVKVLEEASLRRLNMNAFLSVSQGSIHPGKLVCIEYKNAPNPRQAPAVLIGKGITFDTGGISIKPSSAMDEMKFDMSGAGSVLGTLIACIKLELPINIVGILACAENMPGHNASKPGDVVTTMSGQTVEILNTDAEGRLVLCDALSYVQKYYKPDFIIDIATLTGACIVALGHEACGLMSNHQPLADALLKAGHASGDRAWQLPLWDDYQSQLNSNFADIANIGGRGGGTITAACFLSRFVDDYHWAHLDVAGTAWKTAQQKGSTGRPVPLLVEFLLSYANC